MTKAFLKKTPIEYWQQERKECGAYVMKAVLSLFGKDGCAEPKKYLSFTSNFCYGFTSPLRIMNVLRMHDLDIEFKRAKRFKRKKRLEVLKYHLRKQEPVILLVGNSFDKKGMYRHFRRWTQPHWVLLLGYDDSKKRFYLYNPNIRPDKHHDVPVGNVSLSYRMLRRQWRGIFLTGLFNYVYMPVRDPTQSP